MSSSALTIYSWQYADWTTQPTPALQLEQLNLHIAEVSAVAGDFSNGGNRMRLAESYLQQLFIERRRLHTTAANVTDGPSRPKAVFG